MGERDDRLDEGRGIRICRQVLDETAIDIKIVYLEAGASSLKSR
jgi:hypothetical protein